MVSRLLGFIRAAVLAQTIGVAGSAGADMFGLANQLPNSVYTIVAGGTLNAVLVPQIVRAMRRSQDGGQAYINKLLTLSLVVLAATTILVCCATPIILSIYAGAAVPKSSAAFALAVSFAFWCLPQVFFYGLFTMLGEILNARGIFGRFAWAPVLNNVIAIAGVVGFAMWFGIDPHRPASEWGPSQIALLAGSATLGVGAQAVVLFVAWRRAGLAFRCDFRWRGAGFREAMCVSNWMIALVVLTQLVGVIQTNVTLMAVGGSIAALQTAWLVFMLPHSVVTVSLSTAYFTRMSRHGAAGEVSQLRDDTSAVLRRCALVVLWATAFLIVACFPIARLFAASHHDVRILGSIVAVCVLGAVGFSIAFVVQRAFFAQSDTRMPFFLGLAQLLLFVALIVFAAELLPPELLGVGIAAAYSLSYTLQAAASVLVLRRRWGGRVGGRVIVTALTRYGVACMPAILLGSLAAAGVGSFTGGFAVSSVAAALVGVVVIATVMAVCYCMALALLRAPDVIAVNAYLRHRRRGRA